MIGIKLSCLRYFITGHFALNFPVMLCLSAYFLSTNVLFTLIFDIVVSLQILLKGNSEWQRRRNFLSRQQTFIDKLVRLVKTVARESGNRKKKVCSLFIMIARKLRNITLH